MHHVPDALSRMHEVSEENLATPEIEVINLLTNPTSSWYFRCFLAVTHFPETFPNWHIVDNKLYHYRPDPVISTLVPDLNEWKFVPSDEERESILEEAGFLGQRIVQQPWILQTTS